jgi:formate C-acetyltransferase
MKQLLEMLAANWQGYEAERRYIYKNAPFFGNDEDISNEIARRVDETFRKITAPKRNIFGFRFLIGTMAGYRPHYAWFGYKMHATPDTRYDGDAYMVGAGQTCGKDRYGTSALLNSVAQMDPTGILVGPFVCNVLFEEKCIREDTTFEQAVNLIEAYFKSGGLQVQLNYVSKEELQAALEHPEEHENLRVRVSGFSAYYTRLNKDIQQDILARTVKEV